METLFETRQKVMQQYFTPEWAAQELVDRYFHDLTSKDLVLEPSAGRGAFLKAIPETVPAIGVELDPELAQEAEFSSGRRIICGDFCTVDLPEGITAIVGNPPFEVRLIEKFIARSRNLSFVERIGFLLPAYAMQTHRRVTRWLDFWSMKAEIIPRRLFPRLRLPLVFVYFTRNSKREMVGFALYPQACAVDRIGEMAREIYRMIEPRRPTPNAWWKEKVRQVLQLWYESVGEGRWRSRAIVSL